MTTQHPVHQIPGQPLGDDFTQIRGIGPGIANRLHTSGILRFTQLASLSPEEIVAATGGVIGLTVERVAQQDWTGQARTLAETPMDEALVTGDSGDHLHYAIFTIELLLDEGNRVRRTRLVDVRAGVEDAWVGWDSNRMAHFMADRAGLQAEPEPEPVMEPASAMPGETTSEPQGDILAGQMEICNLTAVHPHTGSHKRILPSDQPFAISLTLDLSQVTPPAEQALHCHTIIQAKELSSGTHLTLAEWDQEIEVLDQIQLKQENSGLPIGIYRMEAASVLRSSGMDTPDMPQLSAFLEGNLLQVF